MLRKTMSFALALCLALALSACKKTDNSPTASPTASPTQSSTDAPATKEPEQTSKPEDNGNNSAPGGLTASITPAEGWELRDNPGTRIQYAYADTEVHNTLINLDTEENILNSTGREFVEKRIESHKLTLESWNPVFTDIADVSVGEHDALAYDVTMDSGELQKLFFIFEDSYVYIIQCVTMTEFWETVSDDFQIMTDSFTLK